MSTNYMTMMGKALLRDHPEDFTLTDESVAEAANRGIAFAAECRKTNAARKPKTPATHEYDGLRRQNFALNEEVKNCASYAKTMDDQARGTKERITALLKRKKTARAAGQINDERFLENQVRVLETDAADYEKNATNGHTAHQRAKAALVSFEAVNGARLVELGKELT